MKFYNVLVWVKVQFCFEMTVCILVLNIGAVVYLDIRLYKIICCDL